MCDVVSKLLKEPKNKYVLEHLQGKHNDKGRSQSCENWFQVELVKWLDKKSLGKVEMECADGNSDIVLRKNNCDEIHIEIKINPDSREVKEDCIKLKKSAEGYFLILSAMRDKLKKYMNDEEQFRDKSAIKLVQKKTSERICVRIVHGQRRIGIGCVRLDNTHQTY